MKKATNETDDAGKVFDYKARRKREKRKYYLESAVIYLIAFILGLLVKHFLIGS